MPVVHSSASAFSTAGVFNGHGPSSKVSTTSLSRRKSSFLKCSKPKPGPAVVSISTVRPTPSAPGVLHAALAGCGGCAAAGAAAGAAACGAAAGGEAAPLAGGVCAHAALEANNETVLAKINPAAIRILFSLKFGSRSRYRHLPLSGPVPAPTHRTLVAAAPPTQRLSSAPVDLSLNRLIRGTGPLT